MEACHEQSEQLRKEERVREREKSREISEELKQLCEGGACSLEHIQAKRKEFTLELEEMRRSSEVSETWISQLCGVLHFSVTIGLPFP